MKPQDMIELLTPPARSLNVQYKIPASFTIAQCALETGWMESVKGNNLFGIKADSSWKGAVIIINTHECINGKMVPKICQFRAYKTYLGSLEDHAQFLIKNERYKSAFGSPNGLEFTKAVAKAGYATDPDYANKIIGIILAHNLLSLDH